MPRFKLVFDLDDTLYPERQFAISGFRACETWLEREHGKTGIVDEMTRLLDDGHMRPLFEITLKSRVPSSDETAIEAFIDIYRRHTPQIALYDDAVAALAHFEPRGPLGLITDGSHDVQASKVKALCLEPRFHHIIYTSALGGRAFSKPNPLAFERMEQALADPGDRLVYVGDNPAKDFVAPNARGWISVQIHRPQRIHLRAATAPGGEPQHVIDALTELPALLAALDP